MMKTCTKVYADIPFAHRQHSHDGHCRHIHGHNWSFEFTFACDTLNKQRFVIDFGKLKVLKQWIEDLFDHATVLSSDDPLAEKFHEVGGSDAWNITLVPDASCEGLAEFLFVKVNEMLKMDTCFSPEDIERGIKVVSVTVREDSKNFATFAL